MAHVDPALGLRIKVETVNRYHKQDLRKDLR